MFTLNKILNACIISVNTQIIKWHNKGPDLKSLLSRAMAMFKYGPAGYYINTILLANSD